MASSFQAVFFDFGGTLFSYRSLGTGTGGRSLFREASERLGYEGDPRAIGRAYRDASKSAWKQHGARPYYLHREVFEDTFRGFAERLGLTAPDDYVEWFYNAQRSMLVDGFELRDDCIKTLQALRDEGLYLSIVSNIDDDYLHPMVERVGLQELLDHWTSSEEARSCKPDPGFFRLALEKAGCEAEAVLFVGDSREHDVAGARPLGMTTALIVEEGLEAPGQGVLEAADPHHEITSLSELLPIVRGS